ncbi:unnamed protein product, partial [marine sediment metagenome]
TKDRTIFFLLDVSESINAQNRKTAEDYIKKSLKKMKEGDKAGIIVFARQAFVESLPQSRLEFSNLLTRVNADYTNIVAALELAAANFPQKGSKKIVLLSDGNQNRKEARVLLDSLTKKGIEVDILPLVSLGQEESLLEALIVPQRIKQGEVVLIDKETHQRTEIIIDEVTCQRYEQELRDFFQRVESFCQHYEINYLRVLSQP